MSDENELPTACNCRIALTLNKQSPLLGLMWNQISPNRNITTLCEQISLLRDEERSSYV